MTQIRSKVKTSFFASFGYQLGLITAVNKNFAKRLPRGWRTYHVSIGIILRKWCQGKISSNKGTKWKRCISAMRRMFYKLICDVECDGDILFLDLTPGKLKLRWNVKFRNSKCSIKNIPTYLVRLCLRIPKMSFALTNENKNAKKYVLEEWRQ